jgi:hypothetical protein
MIKQGRSPAHVATLLASKEGGDLAQISDADRKSAAALRWMPLAPARELRRMDALDAAIKEYPRSQRLIMPTKLGNTLRAREEYVLQGTGGTLETFVQQVFDELPQSIQVEHDQYRSRLNLYCSLVLVFVVSGVMWVSLLGGYESGPCAAGIGIALALISISYRAAVASARAYGGLLMVIAARTKPSDAAD